jgi:hypothetical protein
MTSINYALQVCDLHNRESRPRLISDDRTLISKKSICSFFESLRQAAETHLDVEHRVVMILDQCTPDLRYYCELVKIKFESTNIIIEIQDLYPLSGITHSIRQCYRWLSDQPSDLVFQVQDDYLFELSAITESIDMWYQIYIDTGTHAIVQPFNDFHYWYTNKYRSNQLVVIMGHHKYWIQIYDLSCSFITSRQQFVQHWDLYEKFFQLIGCKNRPNPQDLENISLNYILTKRGVLGVTPIYTLSHHLQHQHDFYLPPDQLWAAIDTQQVYQQDLF